MAKIVDERVAGAVVQWTQASFELSISVGGRVHGEYLNGLKFWAAFWRDDARLRVRHLSKPVELIAPAAVVARLAELGAYSRQSELLMTVLWEQFEALGGCLSARRPRTAGRSSITMSYPEGPAPRGSSRRR